VTLSPFPGFSLSFLWISALARKCYDPEAAINGVGWTPSRPLLIHVTDIPSHESDAFHVNELAIAQRTYDDPLDLDERVGSCLLRLCVLLFDRTQAMLSGFSVKI
jgi:hypothetical protein